MNITQKDFYMTWRRPLIWLVLALLSFILAWLFWQLLDRYSQLQLSLQVLPNPPSITEALWVPYVLTLAKLLVLLVALTAGFSFAQERAQKTLWYLLINRTKFAPLVIAKTTAQWPIFIWIWLQLAVVAALLATGGSINGLQMLSGAIGLSLLLIWLMALGQLISSYCQSTGTAVLLNVVVFVLLWMLNGESMGEDFGLNWLSLVSPVHHLQWFCAAEVSVSSLLYFIGGSGVFMWLTTRQLKRLRQLI
jgi:ABC-type transport system involved in multi-copper enzyme maturation permease subunit